MNFSARPLALKTDILNTWKVRPLILKTRYQMARQPMAMVFWWMTPNKACNGLLLRVPPAGVNYCQAALAQKVGNMAIDKSKQIYSSWSTNDIDLTCFCGENVHFGDIDDENSSQATCGNCGQVWVMFLSIVAVKEPPNKACSGHSAKRKSWK